MATIAAPLMFGAFHGTANAACTSSGANLSCGTVKDFTLASDDWVQDQLTTATSFFQSVGAMAFTSNTIVSSFFANFSSVNEWGYSRDGNGQLTSVGYVQSNKNAGSNDNFGWHQLANENSYSKVDANFSLGNVSSDKIQGKNTAQTAQQTFSAYLSDLEKTVSNGIVTYTATMNFTASANVQGCKTVLCSARSNGGINLNDSNTITLASVQAVPGPEAGAGIGAIAMGGMALYLKRRRQGTNPAA
ncbi:hypothetical protein [Oryzifoliimicrobium ureilyticus]|uniref:hypothetical protein n=1 Tax=Oryzifoliimicrobium ureilyticus TaxID=3113724 RepID=UPI0030765859